MDYKEAGVDVEKGDLFVEKIKKFIGDTYTDQVVVEWVVLLLFMPSMKIAT